MAFTDFSDMAYSMKYDLDTLIKNEIPIKLFTYSLSLYDILTKATVMAEKAMTIDFHSLKAAYEKKQIAEVTYMRSEYSPADAFKNSKGSESVLNALETGFLKYPNRQ